MTWTRVVPVLSAIAFAPLLLGVINKTKAFFAGRVGPPLLQTYYDVWKLLQKGAVYSRTTTQIFRWSPVVNLAAVLVALTLVPLGGLPALLALPGDLLLVAALLALSRFFTILAALDTGSSFEGMGGSREAQISALVEPVLLLGLIAVARETGQLSLSEMVQAVSGPLWLRSGPELALVAGALFVVLLAENARIPVDDPNTHLELTMVHEVMVLDHGGPDFGFITYGAALKLWLFGALVVGLLVPVRTGRALLDGGAALAAMLLIAVVVGMVESSMARLRLPRFPQLLVGAGALAILALAMVLR